MGESVAPVAGIEQMVAEAHANRQLALVREHWASVRRLWLAPDALKVARLGPDLPPDFWIGCGMPGIGSVTALGDRFEFADTGLTAVVIPAYDCLPSLLDATPERHVEHLVDLVAVDLDHPDRFWRRRGEAVVLGSAYLEIAAQELAPVPVFRNPLTWLKSGGAGIVVLDWNYAWDLLLGHELIAEDIEIGNHLEAALAPEIWVMGAAA